MNVVFWIGVGILAVIVWYLLSRFFFNIGSNVSKMIDEVKKEMKRKDEDDE